MLSGPASQYNCVRALHARHTITWRLFGDGGSAMVGMGQIREHGALCLSKHADSGIRRRRADHVSNNFKVYTQYDIVDKYEFTRFFLKK